MEQEFVERWSRRLVGAVSWRALAGLGLAATLGITGESDARKKKKKCAKKCKDGCCTGKRGKCIRPAQQTATQCGTGGEFCRNTGCDAPCTTCECSGSRPCSPGQCCRGDGTCGACLVFVTSTDRNGSLGGLTGADAICQGRAAAAGLPGVYMAWLSDGSASPSTRFTLAAVPYTLPNGNVIASSWSDLTDGMLNQAIDRNEFAQLVTSPPAAAWTNTLPNGALDGSMPTSNCDGWTSAAADLDGKGGLTSFSGPAWTFNAAFDCNTTARLYCFQQR